MISTIIIEVILLVLGAILAIPGVINGWSGVTIDSIPLVGEVVHSALLTAVGYWNTFLNIVPYLQLPWHLFLWVILPFEMIMILLRLVLGSRLPVSHN